MAPRCPELHQFEQADQDDRNGRDGRAALPVGETEGQPDQNEGERVFAVLAEVGMGAQAWGPERCKGHGSREQPSEGPAE